MTEVLAPCAGEVISLAQVPDPVFAQEMVGSGVAINPTPGVLDVMAPIAGTLAKVHPHAFVVLDDVGVGILVHLGIDTVRLKGNGFEVHVTEGQQVQSGERVVTWDPSAAVAAGYSLTIPVIAVDTAAGTVTASPGPVTAGDTLFTL